MTGPPHRPPLPPPPTSSYFPHSYLWELQTHYTQRFPSPPQASFPFSKTLNRFRQVSSRGAAAMWKRRRPCFGADKNQHRLPSVVFDRLISHLSSIPMALNSGGSYRYRSLRLLTESNNKSSDKSTSDVKRKGVVGGGRKSSYNYKEENSAKKPQGDLGTNCK